MDKEAKRKKLIKIIEEDIQVLHETLGNFQRMSVYDRNKNDFVKNTEENIEFMMELRKKVINNPL